MRNLVYTLALLAAAPVVHSAELSTQFITAKLAYGASVNVPKSWQVLKGNELRAIETSVGAAIDLSGYAKTIQGTETLIVSTFPDPQLYAGMTITSTPTPGVTPSLPASLTDAQVRAGEATIRQGIESMQARLGTKVFGWTPLRKLAVGRNTVMYTTYLRSSEAGDRRVHIYKFFGSGRIYDLALSTSIAHEALNGVVLQKIANSFVAP